MATFDVYDNMSVYDAQIILRRAGILKMDTSNLTKILAEHGCGWEQQCIPGMKNYVAVIKPTDEVDESGIPVCIAYGKVEVSHGQTMHALTQAIAITLRDYPHIITFKERPQ